MGQSDYRIFKLTLSLEQNDGKAWFFNVDIDSWKLKGFRTLKLAVSHEGINEINWFLMYW